MKDNHHNIAPWDEGFYQTGTVAAPHQRGGLIMVLLVAVVLLGGAVTIMGLLNIRLFVTLKQQEKNALQLHDAQNEPTERETTDNGPGFEMVLSPVPMEIPSAEEIHADIADTMVNVFCGGTKITGVVMHRSGYIVTNRHAVVNADHISVQLPDKREYAATVVGSDVLTNLAVLYIDAEGLTPAVFGDSEEVQVGDEICTIAPSGSLTNGTVQTIGGDEIPAIGIDAQIYSGEPLLDRYGRVIGISSSQGYNGILVVPTTIVKNVVEQLVHHGFVSGRPGLGIQCEPISLRYQNYYNLPAGLYISQITTAQASQALESGDVLLALNGVPLSDSESLIEVLSDYRVGDDVYATILRDGKKSIIPVTIEETTHP